MDEAMRFYNLPPDMLHRQIHRVMVESAERFNHASTASHYIDLYEKMLKRPLLK